jgi:hypothetical protein
MYETSKPGKGRSQRVTATGFANAVQAVAGKCKQVLIKARDAVTGTTGGAASANSDAVIVYVGEAGTGTATFTGYTLQPGEAITLAIQDVSMIQLRGASGDSINIVILS